MIYAYLGCGGSGKTLHSTNDIALALEVGACLIVNFPINVNGIKVHEETEINIVTDDELVYPDKIIQIIEDYIKEHGVRYTCIVLDECQGYFDSREWNRLGRKEWLQFFSKHRHYGRDYIDIILMTQVEQFLDKRLLKQIEYKYYHRNISHCGTIGFMLGLIFPTICYYTVEWTPAKLKKRGKFIIARKKYRNMYDTYYMPTS